MTCAEESWPEGDPELSGLLATMDDAALHGFMCDCAEHALDVCEPTHRAAGYALLPEREPLAVKRGWLSGQRDDGALAEAQAGAVWWCYWGNPIALGAAVLGATWRPGSGLTLAEDEHYAESMTWYGSALEATCDVMREAVKGVGDVAFGLAWVPGDPAAAQEAARVARADEQRWQRERARALVRAVRPPE